MTREEILPVEQGDRRAGVPMLGAIMAAASAGLGLSIVRLDGGEELHRLDRMEDRLDILSFLADDRPRRRPIQLSGPVRHIVSEKPVSKRRARRLRAKARLTTPHQETTDGTPAA